MQAETLHADGSARAHVCGKVCTQGYRKYTLLVENESNALIYHPIPHPYLSPLKHFIHRLLDDAGESKICFLVIIVVVFCTFCFEIKMEEFF